MNTGGDAAEQIVRLSLEGFEVAARVTGSGAKNIAVLLYTILSQRNKTKGKARLNSMLRSGKELKVFTVKNEDLKKFTQEAKKYGVLYCVMTDRKNKDPKAEIDVIARAEDAAKIDRIVEKFNLASVDTGKIVTEAVKSKDAKANMAELDTPNNDEKEKLLDALLSKPTQKDVKADKAEPELTIPDKNEKERMLDNLMGKPMQKEENAPQNPSVAKTEKSPPSEPTLKKQSKSAEGVTKPMDKPSVRKQLWEIKESRKEKVADVPPVQDKAKKPIGKTTHKQPAAKKKSKNQRSVR